ncbi:tetratricopeptide repeat protein [Luteimonas sp. RD2P54]|uniref:Ancillary SecYEG translocon subunit n=1 Tax=Luteimonas endophytica TaxID=3042023 RepID=A0ABT6J3Q4_9GAMM|nr:tetratricopeptide repeat protein [Luteimonas endophytica]MDH5821455.1 tetratricopeptide repeat protein [Luteimonas endophytica]
MAIELLDEHEQGERVRDWLRRNGLGLVAGVAVGLAIIGGWQWWQRQQLAERMQAGERYQAALASLRAGDLEQGASQAAALRDGPYATLVVLDLAKAQLEAGDRDAAIATLEQGAGADPVFEAVRRQRLARLLIDADRAGEAVELLAGTEDVAGLEVLGDASFAMDRREEAREAYLGALRQLDANAPQRRLLELKLTQAGGTPPQPETI